MKINWKVRLKNKAFLAAMLALVISLAYQVLALFDVVPRISQDSVTEAVGIALNLMVALGVIIDPTTDGVSDSERALTYGTDSDVRNTEGDGGSGAED